MAKGLFSSGLSGREIHSDWYEHLDAGSCFVLDEILMPQETLQGKQYNVVPKQHVYLTRKAVQFGPFSLNCYIWTNFL